MARVRQVRSSKVGRLHRTSDVPQADRLGNVRQLVAAIRDGIEHAGTLLELLDVDHRHFRYYRQAAVILGVVEFTARGELSVTSLGRRLLASVEGSREERQVFGEAIGMARGLRPFGSFFAGEALDLRTVTHRLEVLTGLSHTTAQRRAHTLIKWRRYVQGPDAEKDGSLDLSDPAPQIEALVARHNALAKQQTLQWLMGVEPSRFEAIVADLLRAMGYVDVVQRGGPLDGGVDVVARRVDAWGHRAEIAVQAKRYSAPVGRRFVDELLGAFRRQHFAEALLVTTSDFSVHAVQAAHGEPNLKLVDGPKFVDMLAAHGVLLQVGKFGELKRQPTRAP
ncbi:MAG: restriction endonuclease [Nannocystis sp.]|nr:restriction endonuclease [Nannocystis sp.]MBA3549492.1 restriction endonuclease [Nannocystis sp.]